MNSTVRLILSIMGSHESFSSNTHGPVIKDKKVKNCLNCKQEHTHNNCYCSARCCKDHKNES